MSQMRLITDSRDEWTLKELLETLHAKMNALELKLNAQIASPTAVVPFEDEAAPVVDSQPPLVADPSWEVLASCTQCDTKAYTEAGIEDFFGWRKMEDGKIIRQSWCRECRSSGKDKTESASNEPIKYPKWLQDINREARYLAAEAEVVWQQMESIKQSRTGKDRDAYVTRTLRDKAVEFADYCTRSHAKRQENDRARKEYQTNGNK